MSSRTYLSTLERGLKAPTIEKVAQLAGVLNVHPVTLLLATFIHQEERIDTPDLIQRIQDELMELGIR